MNKNDLTRLVVTGAEPDSIDAIIEARDSEETVEKKAARDRRRLITASKQRWGRTPRPDRPNTEGA